MISINDLIERDFLQRFGSTSFLLENSSLHPLAHRAGLAGQSGCQAWLRPSPLSPQGKSSMSHCFGLKPSIMYLVIKNGIKCLNLTKLHFRKQYVSNFMWLHYLWAEFIKVVYKIKIKSPLWSSPLASVFPSLHSHGFLGVHLSVSGQLPSPLATALHSARHPTASHTHACPAEIIQHFQYSRTTYDLYLVLPPHTYKLQKALRQLGKLVLFCKFEMSQ